MPTDRIEHQREKRYSISSDPNHAIIVDRPIITQNAFNQVFIPTAYEDRTPVIVARQIRGYLARKCLPSKQCSKAYLKILFPFLSWLKIYQLSWLPNDIVCGVTVAIMQIPQGMAYALLARLPAIIGLYISFFPSLIYAFFGTSRHLSMGAIAVISLMTGNVVDRVGTRPLSSPLDSTFFSNTTNEMSLDPNYAVTIASTLGFTIGIIQIILCIFHLGFVTSFFSDSFISGYTSGTAILVLTSQIPDIFGLSLKRYSGPFNIIFTYIEILSHLHQTNIATLVISLCSIIMLVSVKEYLEPFYRNKIRKISVFRNVQIPIPIELFVIILGTLISYFANLNGLYRVKIVNTIGQGFRSPASPAFGLIPSIFKDAIIIAMVSFAISISLAKTYAKKFQYVVDSNQELAAFGLCNIIGSFFSTYACAASLSRTSVFVNVGGRTQLASAISSISLLIIILKIGPLFESLPKACLAAIIVVALKSLLLQIKDCYNIGLVTKLEGIVWIVTFLSTILLDVDYGLIIGIIVSLIVVILRQFRPRITILGQYKHSEVYKNVKHYTDVHEYPHIKIFRFESPIIYFNADYFRVCALEAVNIDVKTGRKDEKEEFTHIVIDCASVNQLDYSGGKIFIQTLKELNDCQYKVYLCNLRYYNYDLLEKLKLDDQCSVTITATIHDAVHKIQQELTDSHHQIDQFVPSDSSNHQSPVIVMRF